MCSLKDYESQHIERRADRLVHIPGQYSQQNGGTEEDIKARIQKASLAFIMLRTIWRAKKMYTKLRIFNSNDKTVLFYGSETWRSTQKTLQRIQHYSLENDQATTHRKLNKEEKMEVNRKHTLETSRNHPPSTHHMEPPPGKRRRGRPRNTWQRDTERETKSCVIPAERWRGWPRTENNGVPWSMAISKYISK